jgi:hypothetical protein
MSCSHPELSEAAHPHAFVHNKADGSVCRTDACGVCFAPTCVVGLAATGFVLECPACKQIHTTPECIATYLMQCLHLAETTIAHVHCVMHKLFFNINYRTEGLLGNIQGRIRNLFRDGDFSRLFCLAKIAAFTINKLAILSSRLAFFNMGGRRGQLDHRIIKSELTAANDIATAFARGSRDLTTLRHRPEDYPAHGAECFIYLNIDQFFLPRETAGPVPDSFLYTEWRRDVQSIPARSGCNRDKMASIAAEIRARLTSLTPASGRYSADAFSGIADLALFHIWIARSCPVHKHCPRENDEQQQGHIE